MNIKNAYQTGKEEGERLQQDCSYSQAAYLFAGQQVSGYFARSQKAKDLFIEGWNVAWIAPQGKPDVTLDYEQAS